MIIIISTGLSICPENVKALYRRCQAYQALGEVEKSYTDAVQVKTIEPGNKAVEEIFVSFVKALSDGFNYIFFNQIYHMII